MGLQQFFYIKFIYIAYIVSYIQTETCGENEMNLRIEDPRVLVAARAVLNEFKSRYPDVNDPLKPNVHNLVISSLIKGRPRETQFPKTVNYRLTFCAVPVLACQERPLPGCPVTHVCSAFIDETQGLRVFQADCNPDVDYSHYD